MLKKIISKLQIIFIPCQSNDYRPKFLASRFLFYFFIALILLKLAFISSLFYFPETLFFAEISRSYLVELTNQERENLGINLLRINPQLNEAALLKAQDMLDKDYFSHQSPEGIVPWHWFGEADYSYQKAGENLGIGFLDSEEIYWAWYDSPSHKANLLNSNFQDIGIAILTGEFEGAETTVVVQLFGSPLIEKIPEEKEPSQPEEKEPPQPEEKEPSQPEEKEPSQTVSGVEQEKEILSGPAQGPEIKRSIGFSFFRFMTTNYNDLVQKIIFFSLALIVISLMVNILVKFNVQHKDLIWKTVFLVVILGLFVLINKELIIQFIPHSLSIY